MTSRPAPGAANRRARRAEARKAAKLARKEQRLAGVVTLPEPTENPVRNFSDLPVVNLGPIRYTPQFNGLPSTPPVPEPQRTGPTGRRSAAGKARSSLNNLKHGLTGSFRVMERTGRLGAGVRDFKTMEFESQSQYDDLVKSLEDEHKPEGATEELLVRKMAEHLWLSRRAQMLLDASLNDGNEREISLYMRYGVTNDRAFSRCLNDLLKLRREKRAAAKAAQAAISRPLDEGENSTDLGADRESVVRRKSSGEFESQKAKAAETAARVRLANARATALELDNDRKKLRRSAPAAAETMPNNALKRETELPAAV